MLTGKQKRYLRSLAVNEKAVFQVGKDGLTDNLYQAVKEAVGTRELIKIAVLKSCQIGMRQIAIDICANTGCELVQIIGRSIVLFRQSKEKIIKLP